MARCSLVIEMIMSVSSISVRELRESITEVEVMATLVLSAIGDSFSLRGMKMKDESMKVVRNDAIIL